MVHRCCISSCGMNVRVAEAKGLSYHGFPQKEPLREQWIQAIIPHLDKPETFKVVPKYTRVCSRHFRKKDYSVDIKKRARLNSNAVPSVFPRKSSPIVIPNVLSSPTRAKGKGEGSSSVGAESCSSSLPETSSPRPSLSSATKTLLSWQGSEEEGDKREEEIQELRLTVRDGDGAISSSSLSQEDLSQSSNLSLNNEDSNEAPQKKRKRRKWNRSAFDRPAKGQRKVVPDGVIDGVGEALAEISLSTLLAITNPNPSSELTSSVSAPEQVTSSDPLFSQDSLVPPNENIVQVQVLSNSTAAIEQELLQSIQAVSLHCGDSSDKEKVTRPPPPPFLHHSSEESIFSTTEEDISSFQFPSATTNTSSSAESNELLSQVEGPTLLEIENLANHFNTSLLTNFTPITLCFGLEDLHLPCEDAEKDTPSASTSSEDIQSLVIVEGGKSKSSGSEVTATASSSSKAASSPKKKKVPDNVRLSGVSKKYKKERICGQFSVERFSNSDKDIEYYTGFSSYRNFEAFFRSLEAYVERLRVTDVMFGVANLDNLQSDSNEALSELTKSDTTDSEFVSPLPPPPAFDEPQKRRPFHGRSMSRIDELFMTIIRLRRKLPEKVLGHMFCISQPTVSRIIRAWTVLLSKLIDCYPVENAEGKGKSGKSVSKEHSYTSKGLGIPDSFRQLFHSELAQSIVVTSVSAKGKKSANKGSSSSSTSAKRPKKSRVEVEEEDSPNTSTNNTTIGDDASSPPSSKVSSSVVESEVCDLLDPNSSLLFNQLDEDFFQPVNFLSDTL